MTQYHPSQEDMEELRAEVERYLRYAYDNGAIIQGHKSQYDIYVDPIMTKVSQAISKAVEKTKNDDLLQQAIDNSGNEFAMGYNDSGCFWKFYTGARGAGSMMGNPFYQSESPDVHEALKEYLAQLSTPESKEQ